MRITAGLAGLGGTADPFAAAVPATRMPMAVTDPHQADTPIVFANHASCNLTGYARGETLGRNCRFLHGAGGRSSGHRPPALRHLQV